MQGLRPRRLCPRQAVTCVFAGRQCALGPLFLLVLGIFMWKVRTAIFSLWQTQHASVPVSRAGGGEQVAKACVHMLNLQVGACLQCVHAVCVARYGCWISMLLRCNSLLKGPHCSCLMGANVIKMSQNMGGCAFSHHGTQNVMMATLLRDVSASVSECSAQHTDLQ
jgi:hypothetical protein